MDEFCDRALGFGVEQIFKGIDAAEDGGSGDGWQFEAIEDLHVGFERWLAEFCVELFFKLYFYAMELAQLLGQGLGMRTDAATNGVGNFMIASLGIAVMNCFASQYPIGGRWGIAPAASGVFVGGNQFGEALAQSILQGVATADGGVECEVEFSHFQGMAAEEGFFLVVVVDGVAGNGGCVGSVGFVEQTLIAAEVSDSGGADESDLFACFWSRFSKVPMPVVSLFPLHLCIPDRGNFSVMIPVLQRCPSPSHS